MRIFRAIKVAIKNCTKFHPRYLLLAGKNTDTTPGKQTAFYKDVFIITSCVNVSEDKKFYNHNRTHTPQKRIEETVTGLLSVKQYYPNAHIILIESSVLTESQKQLLDPLIDDFYDYSQAKNIKTARTHYNKGVPQFTAYIKFIEENKDRYKATTFHFLGARYVLTGSVAEEYQTSGSYFLFFPQHDNVSTRYFFIKDIPLKKLVSAFRKTLYFAIVGNSVEDILHGFIPELKKVKQLEVMGVVNGKEIIHE